MDLHRLDSDAVRSIQRLGARGHDAYLVGGCVRDLLLDRDPKDFDIATGARPQQVKRAFPRNCRIIGRRFKLAHLHFDGNQKILEVATFRSSPRADSEDDSDAGPTVGDAAQDDSIQDETSDPTGDSETGDSDAGRSDAGGFDDSSGDDDSSDDDSGDGEPRADGDIGDGDIGDGDIGDGDIGDSDIGDSDIADSDEPDDQPAEDLLILRDNEFGTIEEDALRRDFTINALFLNPINDEIIDYVGGLEDVEAHLIRTIGDPETRFREDPIRILRAIKFAGRLSFTFEAATEAAMRTATQDLVRAAPPRILEEILRMLRGGHALPSFQILHDIGGLATLLPTVSSYLAEADTDERRVFWRLVEALDNHIHNGATPSNAVLLGCLFLRPILWRLRTDQGRSPAAIAEEIVGPMARELRLPRRDTGALKRICSVHPRFTASGRRRFRLASFLQDPHLFEATELFELCCLARGDDFDHLERWLQLIEEEHGIARGALYRSPVAAKTDPRTAAAGRGGAPSAGRHGRSRKPDKPGRDARQGRARPARSQPGRPQPGSAKKGGAKSGGAKSSKASTEQRSERRPQKRSERSKAKQPSRKKRDEVLTLEPEAIDVSAFDRELGHREVPRFDTIVETAGAAASKPRRRVKINEDDSYKPPPPPSGDDAPPPPPPPPPAGDVFGDW